MWRRLRDVRLSTVNTALLLFGLGLLVVAALGRQAAVGGTQIGPGVSWWMRAALAGLGAAAIVVAVLASRVPIQELRAGRGFLGALPREPN
jgi:hypothetical protein